MQFDQTPIVEETNNGLKTLTISESSSYKSRNASSAHWSPDVNILLPTSQWLKLYGLKKYKLELKQILSSIGFKHSEEYVRSIKKPVKASYSKGLFPQYSYADGTIYNLLATSEKLQGIVNQLTHVISLYEERLEWLTSSSRLVFGVVQEQTVAIVLDLQCSTRTDLNLIKNAFISLVKEQLLFVSKFNFIRCAPEMQYWHDRAVNVTTDSISGILKWLYNLQLESQHDISATVEGLYQAAKDGQVESIYFCTDGMSSIKAREILKKKLEVIKVPIHIVALNCMSPSSVTFLQDVTKNNSGGRFHKFSLSENRNRDIVLSSSNRLTEMSDDYNRPKMEIGVRKDVIDVWEELDTARNNLAEIQAIQIHVNQKDSKSQSDPSIDAANEKQDVQQENDMKQETKIENELYMSSKDWLKRHSLKAKKLDFYDALSNTAFRHCDGVVEVPNPHNGSNIATVKSKLVNAKYCDKFAHVRWKDGQIFHVHISGESHRNFEKRITAIMDSYKQRIQWLQKGSRELFGTIIEDQVTMIIDTSASMNSRLFLVKDKLYQLLQEQIKHKKKFNLIKFDSRVQAWRSRLVDCTERNLDDAWQWIKGLVVGGSTNTLDALKLALSDPLCHAVYLLTDGRPDQPPLTVLSQVHLQDSVPIHTISFNCSDDAANDFLFKLSQNTNGRFHYFSENGTDSNIPKTYESEDLRLIKEEVEKGINDLQRLTRLRNWCAQLDWYGGKSEENASTRRPQSQPSPQPLIDRVKKETKTIPKRTLKKKKIKKRQAPIVKTPSSKPVLKKEVKSSSSSDSTSEDEKSSVKSQSTESSVQISKSLEVSEEEKEEVQSENQPLEEESRNRESIDDNTKYIEKDDKNEKKVKKKKKKKKAQRPTSQNAEDKLSHAKPTKDVRTPVKENTKGDTPKSPWLRNHKVLARNDVDGFYYAGVLRVNINSRYADVAFCDFESQVVSLRHIIPNEGARPCPTLKVGDYVLVKTVRDGISCYAPGVVYVVPLRQSKVTKYYTVIHYHGKKATSLRKDLVKISQSRYAFACRYIKDCEMTANKSSSISMFSIVEKKKQLKGKDNEKDSSDSSSDSEAGSSKHTHSKHDKRDEKSSSDEENETREDDVKKKDSVTADNINEELARIKQALLETRECQVKSLEEQQERFDDLRQQLKDVMEEQAKRQDELKQHYEALVGGTVEQNDLTKEEQDKRIEEARILLQEQQENMLNDFRKQQKLLEELLRQKPGDQKGISDKDPGIVQEEKGKNRSSSQSSSTSDESSSQSAKKSPPETPHENDLSPDVNDGAPSKMEFHISSGKEACLWTKGSRGLLISRVPLEEDPAVENRPVPTLLKSGEEVLARWPDDGWYYRGTIREPAGDNYFVEDSVGNMEEISRMNIITDEDDAANNIKINDAVVALHPSFSFSYAPGVVMDVPDNLLYNVRFYDGHEDVVPREEVYFLTQQMFSNAVNFIVCCEESLVGQAAVARNDLDGYFYLATIRERVGNGRQYIVQWPEGTAQVQNSAYIFGAHTKRHQLAVGDKVLSLSNTDRALYEPGWITGIDGKKINVKLSSGKRSNHVDSMQCFWLSGEYYDRIVDYIIRNKSR